MTNFRNVNFGVLSRSAKTLKPYVDYCKEYTEINFVSANSVRAQSINAT